MSLFALLSLIVTSFVALPQAAVGAVNDRVVVNEVVLTSSDGGPLTVGDVLTVTGKWDASEAEPQPGDEFFIGLPPELGFEQEVPFDLPGMASDGTSVTWAECVTDPATFIATCTFTDAVATYPVDVRGEFELEVKAIRETTEERVEFNLNGREVMVDLPGGGGIDDGIEVPTEWSKNGSMNDDRWSMSWWIDLPGALLAGNDVVTIGDTLSDNHVLCESAELRVVTIYGSEQNDVTAIATLDTDPASAYDFEVALDPGEAGFDAGVTYRISYQTCTPDGEIDAEGTEYTNEAFIDVWGESSGVIGVEQEWSISDTITKGGGVLGGAARNGTISWTVTVPGDKIAGLDSFVLDEVLGGQHEVCASTIDNIRVHERYGPSTARQTNITDQLVVTEQASDAQSFSVEIALAAGSDIAFRDSDWIYVIEYVTCATTDGLPEAGTTFDNEVTILGETVGSQAETPGRSEGKNGRINGSRVTLDGYEYLPQTTLGWTITVPGEKLQKIEGPLEVTDVLSGTHEVCAANDGPLSDRLGLSVRAIDQIGGGGLATVDLTDTVDVTQDGDELLFVIAEPELVQPGGELETGFSREYQYEVSYTTCTTTGGMDAPGTAYGNEATVAGTTYTHSVTQSNRGSGSGQGMPRGTVSVSKALADTTGAELVAEGTEFTVRVVEIDPAGAPQDEYTLRVPLDGEPVSGFNARGRGWTAQLTEPTFPTVPGVVFATPSFAATDTVDVSDDGATAIAQLTPGGNVDVELTNTALLGAVEVTKELVGGAADQVDAALEYDVTASIDVSELSGVPAQPDRELSLTAGEEVLLEDLPIGATVAFSENVPEDDDTFTWGEPVFTPSTIVVGAESAADPELVTITNSVERTVGTFSLSKLVEGAEVENPAAPSDYTVTATWNDEGEEGEKQLTLPADGTAVPLDEQLLIGTEVVLTEEVPADGSGIAWSAPIWAGANVTVDGESAVVTIGRDADAAVTVTNHAATSTAGISLLKGIAGEAADEVDASTEFPVVATWTDADGEEQSVDLAINALEPTPLGVDLPAGTVVTVTEGEQPGIDTVVWQSITISGDDVADAGDGSAEVTVSDQQGDDTLVTVINEATWAPGGFSIAKSIEGLAPSHADFPETVTVTAAWNDAEGERQSQDLIVPTDGTELVFPELLPHDTEVTLTEAPLDGTAQFTWADPTWSGDRVAALDDATAVVTIGAADVAAVELENEAIASLGSVEIAKSVSGSGADAVSGVEFPVTVAWTDLVGEEHERELVVADGQSTVVADVPVGTELRIVELEAPLSGDLRWVGAEWTAVDGVELIGDADDAEIRALLTGDLGSHAVVGLDNLVDEEPGLAVTGGAVAVGAAGLGLLLLLLGGGLMLLRRRQLV